MRDAGHPAQRVGQHSLGPIAESDDKPAGHGGGPGGRWRRASPPNPSCDRPTHDRYQAEVTTGARYVGSPETDARRIAATARELSQSRFDLKHHIRHLPCDARGRTIEHFDRVVAPPARELLAAPTAA